MHQSYKVNGSSKQRKVVKIFAQALCVVIIFSLGLLVGDGRISFHKRVQSLNNGLPAKLDYNSVNTVYQALKNNYYQGLTERQLLDGLKHGIAEATKDPYTQYFTASEAKALNGQINNSFSGIGAELGKDSDGNLEVISPIQGLPAQKAGLQAKDLITSINGESTSGILLDDAVNKIRGKEGTKVTLQILRNGSQPSTVSITRQNINLPSVTTKVLNGNIGYMQISSFASDTTNLSQKAATSFTSTHVKGIILDLRNNPGGYLDAAIHLSSLWLPNGQKILDEKRGNQVVNSYTALGGDVLHGIPTVVLINEGSASASEITTGALHDNKAAYVIGEKSYGKGVVQDIICITGQTNTDGTCPADELKVTIASWYRPNGQDINHKGITPDKAVTLGNSDINSSNDSQLNAAEAYLASH